MEVSAWCKCKLHGSGFKGKLIPFAALVNDKPPEARETEKLHQFGPGSSPGVFAGCHIGPTALVRQYKVEALSELTNHDASKPDQGLSKPHLIEKAVTVTPVTFLLKAEYQRMNTTLEGAKEKELLDGEPSKATGPDDDDGPSGGQSSKKPPRAQEGRFDDTLEQLILEQPDHW